VAETRSGSQPDESPLDRPWEVLSSETLIDSSWIRVHRQRLLTTHGYEIPEYYVVDAPDIVVLLAVTEQRQALLVQQHRHPLRRAVLELPAGVIEPSDVSPEQAAMRELREETGYEARELELLGRLSPSPARQSNTTYCFLALDCRLTGQPGGDPTEDIRLHQASLPELQALGRRGELPSQTSLACLFLGLERLRELKLV
jgi:8-oxo-dGTP pyrophosphatase MutT (NUDIX family)